MAHYQVKNFFSNTVLLLSLIFFSTSNYCMQSMNPRGPIEGQIIVSMNLDLQSIGRITSVCQKLNACSFDKIFKMLAKESVCWDDLAKDYDRCTAGLIYFAKEKNVGVFSFLWSFHGTQRYDEMIRFSGYDISGCPINVYMSIYAKEFHKIEEAKERENRKKKKEKEKIVNKEMEKNIRKEKKQSEILKWRLNRGTANLLKLHNKNIDISTLFPHKNDKELLKLLCKNADAEKGFVLMTNKYIAQYPAETMDYLFKFEKFDAMLYLITNGQLAINKQSTSGKTLLHYLNYKCGCQCDLIYSERCSDPQAILDELLQHGADVNIVDNKGMTVLHYACKYLHVNTVKKLLAVKNIDIKKKNKKNKRPIDYVSYLKDYNDGNNVTRDRKFIKLLLQSHIPQVA